MAGLGLVLFAHEHSGSFGLSGLVAGAFTLGFGLGGPPMGRLVDRLGPRPVLPPAAVASTVALIAAVLIGKHSLGGPALVVAATASGLFTPPISGVLRRTWPILVDDSRLSAAYLLDSILIELVLVGGPLCTGVLTACVGAGGALVVAAITGLVGTLWFCAVLELAALTRLPSGLRSSARSLSSPTILLLTWMGLPFGATFGALTIALPAFGAAHGEVALGGILTAALSAGSILGALLFGIAQDRFGDLREACVRLSIAQPLLCLPLLFAQADLTMVALSMLAGAYAAPALTVRNRIAHISMPPGTGTETFTWLLLAVVVGSSLGTVAAGPLVEHGGWRAGVGFAILIPAAWIPFAYASRRLLPTG